jgi:hypothetical protein
MLVYYFVLRLPKVTVPGQSFSNKLIYWSICVLIAVLVVFLRVWFEGSVGKFELIITTISAFLIGLIGASVWTRVSLGSEGKNRNN